jgi:PAS domain S-box-containing protein
MGSVLRPTGGAGSRRRLVLVVAALMFVGVFVLRVDVTSPSHLVTLLYALPIALVAVELGLVGGLAAAGLALAMFGLWEHIWSNGVDNAVLDYVTRGAAFFLLGGVVGSLTDRLRNVSAQTSRFWELSSDMLCTAGFDGYFKRLNPAWERTLGWTLEELRSRPFIEFVHADDRVQTEAEAAKLTSVGYETINFENTYRCKDGSYRPLLWSATAVPDEGLIYAIARDSSETKRAHDELRSSEQFLDSVLENIPNMVFVKDAAELRFVRFNHAGEELIGLSREELIGKSDYDLFPEQEAASFVHKDREVLACDEVVDIPEEPIDTMGKGRRTLHTRKIAIRDQRGEPRYLLGISDDITDRQLAEQAAETARVEAERANRAKSEFLSRMSHELRTPLNAVIGFGQLLELDDLDTNQREGVGQILKAGRHLLELINEVLDISRIESGTMSMSLEPVHLGSVLADALSLIRPLADTADVHLSADPSELTDLHVRADQQRLKQVLINLLSNGVKYNQPGGEISVRCAELPTGRVAITVADTGRGMSDEQLRRLFDPFDRLGAEGTDVEGTGLGLSLSKGLVEAMGGTISAESTPGVGSTMRVELDRAERPQAQTEARNGAPTGANGSRKARRTILYIEDNLSNLRLVERVVARLPELRLIPAMQGKLGIDLARQHQPDLIILDLHLPDLHGREVLQQLKRHPATAPIPVVVMSADATPGQVELLQTAGAAHYLTKPIDIESLLHILTAGLPVPVAATS